ncbi:MAG: hypothetical protein AAF518_04555 [Spirochaetota bacterium]
MKSIVSLFFLVLLSVSCASIPMDKLKEQAEAMQKKQEAEKAAKDQQKMEMIKKAQEDQKK